MWVWAYVCMCYSYFQIQELSAQHLPTLVHMATKRHKHLSHNHLGDTKTSTRLQQNIKRYLLCLHEKLAIITYPSQNILQNKKSEILSKCKLENTLQPRLQPTHTTHLTPRIYIKWSTISTIFLCQPSHPPHNISTRLHHFNFLRALKIGPNALHSPYLPNSL